MAAAGRSITYIMSYGRWRCTESVLRYVKTPLYIRMLDAQHMAASTTQTKWDGIQAQVRGYYAHTHLQTPGLKKGVIYLLSKKLALHLFNKFYHKNGLIVFDIFNIF